MAFWPVGVTVGAIRGVATAAGVEGVIAPAGVAPGVSSHLERLLLAEGVGVS